MRRLRGSIVRLSCSTEALARSLRALTEAVSQLIRDETEGEEWKAGTEYELPDESWRA